MSGFPIVLNGGRVHALVVGGGQVGTRKALALAETGIAVTVVAPQLSEALREAAALTTSLRLHERDFQPGDVLGKQLVIAATDRRAVNAAVAGEAYENGALCNVVDDPDRSSFWTAAVHRDGPLLVAVSTGGVPSAAARIRDAVAAALDARLGDAIRALQELRGRLLAAGEREAWRRAAAELTGPDFVASVETGTFAERVRRWA